MLNLSKRLGLLERRAGERDAAKGPYSAAWKAGNLPPDDHAGFGALWREFWGGASDEQRAGILASYEASDDE